MVEQLFFSTLGDPNVADFYLYHDEIKPERGLLPYLGHGSIYVPHQIRTPFFASLQMARGEYESEVHFREVRGGSKQDQRFQVARA